MMAAYIELAYRRRMGWLSELLGVIGTGTQGTAKSIQKLSRQLNGEAQ